MVCGYPLDILNKSSPAPIFVNVCDLWIVYMIYNTIYDLSFYISHDFHHAYGPHDMQNGPISYRSIMSKFIMSSPWSKYLSTNHAPIAVVVVDRTGYHKQGHVTHVESYGSGDVNKPTVCETNSIAATETTQNVSRIMEHSEFWRFYRPTSGDASILSTR